MKTWTIDEMLIEKPCAVYTRERLIELINGRDRLTLLEILELDISSEDKVWVCCREHPHRAEWLDVIVTRAVTDHALHCAIPEVETWAAKWLSNEDRGESAAYSAHLSAHSSACSAAAYSAHLSACSAAAYSAYSACSAYSAARSAARSAADSAETLQQLKDMHKILTA